LYTEKCFSADGSYLLIQNMQRKQVQSRTVCEFAAVYHPPGEGKVPKYIGRAFQFEWLPPAHPNVVEVVASLVRPDAATAYANVLRMITDTYPEAFETVRKQMEHGVSESVKEDDVAPIIPVRRIRCDSGG